MRYFWLLPCVLISLILLSGCGSSSSNSSKGTDWEPTIHETVNNLEGVTMIVKDGKVSTTGLTVTFENKADKECIYGEYFMLEKKIEGSWYQVPVTLDGNYGFNDIGYELNASDVSEWTADWEWLYGSLDTGEYRIVKDVLDFRKAGDYDKFYLAAEFTID
ncbi:immunoglobulin-like domain-containing protein [Radiobacillus sp. PE A8.2]|uniref:immunoglobulin-like domain-containing protein n=1 Tax=Radiobacillus sp. PE A8.2 TaxID=3380349 RepID=UPI0038906A90